MMLRGFAIAMSTSFARLYFQLIGILFAIATICGFLGNGDLYIMHVNMDDNLLQIAMSTIALLLGFVTNR